MSLMINFPAEIPGGYPGFQATGMIQLGQKSKPKKSPHQNVTPKNPMPNFQAIKISRGTTRPVYAGTITNLQIVLNTSNPYLNQAAPKKYLPKFSYPKKSRSRKFQTQNYLRPSLSVEIRSTPWSRNEKH